MTAHFEAIVIILLQKKKKKEKKKPEIDKIVSR